MPLTSKKVARLMSRQAIGRHPDGTVKGLYLQIASAGAASWILRYERDGRERMAGVGPLDVVGLAEARNRAKAMRLGLLDGTDPIEAKRAAKATRALEAAKAVTFQQAAKAYFESKQSEWRNARHAREFIGSLERYAFPVIGALPVSAIDVDLVLRVIRPLWPRIPETASRVRGRLEMVLDYATALKLRVGDNPARWQGNIKHLLPKRKGTDIEHLAALPYDQVPDFMHRLHEREGIAERGLEFAVLCASRSGEVLGARWPEVDLKRGVWTIDAKRMKGGKQHRVPLPPAATALLENLPGKSADGFVFIGSRPGEPLGKDALARALARVRGGCTVHGFRSSFRDFASERTAFSYAARELALAHAVHSKQSRAYERTDLIDERRKLMEAWATFCYSPAAAGEVVPLRGRR
jgi:integrase